MTKTEVTLFSYENKDWIAFICTNPELSEEEIIRIYGKRWQIEIFFFFTDELADISFGESFRIIITTRYAADNRRN